MCIVYAQRTHQFLTYMHWVCNSLIKAVVSSPQCNSIRNAMRRNWVIKMFTYEYVWEYAKLNKFVFLILVHRYRLKFVKKYKSRVTLLNENKISVIWMSCCVEVCSGKKTTPAEGRKKITFIEQAKKRAECDRLAAYIMTVDLMLNSVLHQVGTLLLPGCRFLGCITNIKIAL